jgi:hypothetical protein
MEIHTSTPFDGMRSYGLFGFLADVRNYSEVPVIAAPQWTIPADASSKVRQEYEEWNGSAHSATWLTLKQLQDFNYDQVFWDRRITRQEGSGYWNGAARAEEGEGEHLPIREFLPRLYFDHLETMAHLGYEPEDVRLVFWFDN